MRRENTRRPPSELQITLQITVKPVLFEEIYSDTGKTRCIGHGNAT